VYFGSNLHCERHNRICKSGPLNAGSDSEDHRRLTVEQGQNIYLVGNTSLLGGAVNDPEAIILPMNPGNYTPTRPEWYIDIYLPAGVPVEYQYVNLQPNGSSIFDNVTYVVDVSPCGGPLVMTDELFVSEGKTAI
jgi:Starch binding domain